MEENPIWVHCRMPRSSITFSRSKPWRGRSAIRPRTVTSDSVSSAGTGYILALGYNPCEPHHPLVAAPRRPLITMCPSHSSEYQPGAPVSEPTPIPTHWYNIAADLPVPPPPHLHP